MIKTERKRKQMKQYDYLIVGAGLYGAVFAAGSEKRQESFSNRQTSEYRRKCIYRRYREDPCTQIRSTYLPHQQQVN